MERALGKAIHDHQWPKENLIKMSLLLVINIRQNTTN
jgi:hypothetical protein